MTKASASRTKTVPYIPPKRASISRSEVTTIQGLMTELNIKDRRTAIALLKKLGLPVDEIHGVVLVSGESFFKAVTNRGGADL